MSNRITIPSQTAVMAVLSICFAPTHADAVDWVRQFGTTDGKNLTDHARAVSADNLGNVFVTGYVPGSLEGTSAGGLDAYLRKYDVNGNELWTRQFGTTYNDRGWNVAADGSGNIYVAGDTGGDLFGTSSGGTDAFLAKYDTAGNVLWSEQFGTVDGDQGFDVSIDGSGNVYVSGQTSGDLGAINPAPGQGDIFVRKYNSAGGLQWTEQFGGIYADESHGVWTDTLGNVFVSGEGGVNNDAFLNKYDTAGNLDWSKEFDPTGNVRWNSISSDNAGNVYIGGQAGSISSKIAFLSKYDLAGNQLWLKEVDGLGSHTGFDVFVDSGGDIYLTGGTSGDLAGANAGSMDAYVIKYDALGNQLWSQQLGTVDYDESLGISVANDGKVFLAGTTSGNLGGVTFGAGDAFVMRLSQIPEPTAFALAAIGLTGISFVVRRGRRR